MLIYDAFSDKVGKGNRTALVEATGRSEEEMQAIAAKLGFAETLFFEETNLRYFSPTEEIDFCGHATLAFAWNRGSEKVREEEIYHTPVGEIPIRYQYGPEGLEKVWMLQAEPLVKEILFELQDLLDALGIQKEDLDHNYPLQAANTGNWDLFVPMKSRSTVDQLFPNMGELAALNLAMGVLSTHLYVIEEGEDYHIYTRDFAPACGIPEDPVTGSANGALYGLLLHHGFIHEKQELVFAQGEALGYQGRVFGKYDSLSHRVWIGGKAVLVERR